VASNTLARDSFVGSDDAPKVRIYGTPTKSQSQVELLLDGEFIFNDKGISGVAPLLEWGGGVRVAYPHRCLIIKLHRGLFRKIRGGSQPISRKILSVVFLAIFFIEDI